MNNMILSLLGMAPYSNDTIWKKELRQPFETRVAPALIKIERVLKMVMIRHVKKQKLNGGALLSLPKRHIETLMLDFGLTQEKTLYKALFDKYLPQFENIAISDAMLRSNYMAFVSILLPLRQLCSHPAIVSLVK
mmetsp:Transcript_12424/g.20181  ORF Transcript_12424/g.20181 Transcript_12424/m.20181 type:complete len:135 (+) Transcript_12424:894-1298(+)